MTFFEALFLAILTPSLSGAGYLLYHHWSQILKFFKKQYLKFFPVQYVMAISILHNEITNDGIYYKSIRDYIKENIELLGLKSDLTLKDFSDIYNFQEDQEAEKFRQQKNIDLIFWGKFSDPRLQKDGEGTSTFIPKFTYGYKHADNETDKERVKKIIQTAINKIHSRKNHWIIKEKNSALDVQLVADSAFVIALFVIGLTLINQSRFEQSEKVLSALQSYLKKQNDTLSILLKPYLKECFSHIIYKSSNQKIVDYKLVASVSGKALDVSNTDPYFLSSLALAQYKTGAKRESQKTVSTMLLHHPNSALAKMNAAFMDILQGKYENALKKYKRVQMKSKKDFRPTDILDFLGEEYTRFKEPGLMFASAFVSFYMSGDNDLAKYDLDLFLKSATDKKYGKMYQEALNIRSKLNYLSSKRMKL